MDPALARKTFDEEREAIRRPGLMQGENSRGSTPIDADVTSGAASI
jgi:hypothetical protein